MIIISFYRQGAVYRTDQPYSETGKLKCHSITEGNLPKNWRIHNQHSGCTQVSIKDYDYLITQIP